MNKTYHFFNNSIYLVSSDAVARNPIFYSDELCNRFLEKIDFYLAPIAEIMHYAIKNSSFQLVVKLKDRKAFCKHYQKQHGFKNQDEVPLSTFIFSKAMNDLLVSTAKHFNYHHQRKGGLFARRFHRKLIESEVQLELTLKELNNLKSKKLNQREWSKLPYAFTLKNKLKVLRLEKERCGYYYYKRRKDTHPVLRSFRLVNNLDRRGSFAHLPPKSIYQQFKRISILYYIPLNTS